MNKQQRNQTIFVFAFVTVLAFLFGFGCYGAGVKNVWFASVGFAGFVLLMIAVACVSSFAKRVTPKSFRQNANVKKLEATVANVVPYSSRKVGENKFAVIYKVYVEFDDVKSVCFVENKKLKTGDSVKILIDLKRTKICALSDA